MIACNSRHFRRDGMQERSRRKINTLQPSQLVFPEADSSVPAAPSTSLPLQFLYTLGCFRLGEIFIERLMGLF
jgi:hypothetical protein